MKPFDTHTGREPRRDVVVLLHSSGASSRQWTALATALGARCEVRALDLYGHGARAPWAGAAPLTLLDEALAIEPVLRERARVHLVGHSYGGAVALRLAARHPAAFASVSVYEPVLFRWLLDAEPESAAARDLLATAGAIRKFLTRGDAVRAAGAFLTYWSGAAAWAALSMPRRETLAARMRSVSAHFDALFGETLDARALQRIASPLLVMSGSETVASTKRLAQLYRAALPDACHAEFAGADHMGPVTCADAVNRRIEAFLDSAMTKEAAPTLRAA